MTYQHIVKMVTFAIFGYMLLSTSIIAQENQQEQNLLIDNNAIEINEQPLNLIDLENTNQNISDGNASIDESNNDNNSDIISSITIDELERIDPSTLGTLDYQRGGYNIDLWQDLSREDIIDYLRDIKPRKMLPELRDALAKMLLSNANLPKGKLLAGNILDQWDVMRERLSALIRMGMLKQAYALSQVTHIRAMPYDMRIWRAELAIWNGNWGDACQLQQNHALDIQQTASDANQFAVPLTPADKRYWNELEIACKLFDQPKLDSLAIEFAVETGKITSEFAFLLEAITNNFPIKEDIVQPSNILQSRLLFLAGHDVTWDYHLGNQPIFEGADLKNYHLTNAPKKNMMAANYLYTLHMISLEDLVKSYDLVSQQHIDDYTQPVIETNSNDYNFAAVGVDSAENAKISYDFVGHINDPVARAVNYQLIKQSASENERLARALSYIEQAQEQNIAAIIRDVGALYELLNAVKAQAVLSQYAPMMVQIGYIMADKLMVEDWQILLNDDMKEKMLLWHVALYGLSIIPQSEIIEFLTQANGYDQYRALQISSMVETLLYRDDIEMSPELWIALSRLQNNGEQQEYAHKKFALEYFMKQAIIKGDITTGLFYAFDAFPDDMRRHAPQTIAEITQLLTNHLKLEQQAWRYLVKQLLHHNIELFFVKQIASNND